MHGRTITEQVAIVLRSLGETPEEIAANLQIGGWLGLRYDAGACPVARYLATVLPDARSAEVGRYDATVHFGYAPDVEADLPGVVRDFIVALDEGSYPELVVQDTDAYGDVIDDADR
jgi:hypothetical protein